MLWIQAFRYFRSSASKPFDIIIVVPESLLADLAHEGHGGGDGAALAVQVVGAVLDGRLEARKIDIRTEEGPTREILGT